MSSAGPRLAVLGHPLKFTCSPQLHRAGLEALGLVGDSHAVPTTSEELGSRLHALAAAGCQGANLTQPLKQAVIGHLSRLGPRARRARSVNTVGLEPGGWWGETTDGPGFIDLLASLGRDPRGLRVVLLGAGGAARSLAGSLLEAECGPLTAFARDPDRASPAWSELGAGMLRSWADRSSGPELGEADAIVNCTPLSAAELATDWGRARSEALVVDLIYGPGLTAWVLEARATGREAHDGLGLLVHQARRSLELWFGRALPVEPLASAVGWPR